MYYMNVQNIEQNAFNLRAFFFLKPCFTILLFVVNVCVNMEKVCREGAPEPCLKKKKKLLMC